MGNRRLERQLHGRRPSLYRMGCEGGKTIARLNLSELMDLSEADITRLDNEQLHVVRTQLKELALGAELDAEPSPWPQRFKWANNEMKARGMFAFQRRGSP